MIIYGTISPNCTLINYRQDIKVFYSLKSYIFSVFCVGMRLPVELSNTRRTCFIFTTYVAIRALFGNGRSPGVSALKMRWGGVNLHVGFAGNLSSRAVIEVPEHWPSALASRMILTPPTGCHFSLP